MKGYEQRWARREFLKSFAASPLLASLGIPARLSGEPGPQKQAGAGAALASTVEWPQFRGPNCSGVAADAKPPITISPTNGLLWSIEVPWSPSSPCVSGGMIFLTTFADGQLQTRCYASDSGRLL